MIPPITRRTFKWQLYCLYCRKKGQEFRDLNRYHKGVIRDITSQKNRVEKFLQNFGFRLSSFISGILTLRAGTSSCT